MPTLILTKLTLREYDVKEIDISTEKANEFVQAKALLTKALDLEILYDQIIEQHWEYENKINYWAMRLPSRSKVDHILGHEIRSSLNRISFNLLNLGKLYLDVHNHERQKKCFAKEVSGDIHSKEKVMELNKGIVKNNLEYVIAYKLRSYSQHSSLPVTKTLSGIRHDQETKEKFLFCRVMYNYDDLIKMDVPKKSITPDFKIDLIAILAGYVSAISEMHKLNRELTNAKISETIIRLETIWSEEVATTGFEAPIIQISLPDSEKIHADLEWFKLFDLLQKKHSYPINHSEWKQER